MMNGLGEVTEISEREDRTGLELMLEQDFIKPSNFFIQIFAFLNKFSATMNAVQNDPDKFQDAISFQSLRVKDVIVHQV